MPHEIVPLISSSVAGPLGLKHLPRLWLKTSLQANNRLRTGYPDIGAGYDSMLLGAVGLDADAVRAYIKEAKPSYPQFEAWVCRQPNIKLDKATIDKSNRAIDGYDHADATRVGILALNGLPDDGSVCHGAISLNNLEDWHDMWLLELGGAAPVATPPENAA